MEIQKMKKMGTIIIEAPEVDAVIIDGGLFVKVMDLPLPISNVANPVTETQVVDDTKPEKKASKPVTKNAPEKEEKVGSKAPSKLKLIKNWASLKEGDKIQVKLAEEYLAEDDDPQRLYNCEVKSVASDDIVEVELIFHDDDLNGSETTVNSEDGSEIYKI